MNPACVCVLVLEHSSGADYASLIGLGIGALVLGIYLFACCHHFMQNRNSRRHARKVQDIYNLASEARRHMDRTSDEFVQQAQQQGRK